MKDQTSLIREELKNSKDAFKEMCSQTKIIQQDVNNSKNLNDSILKVERTKAVYEASKIILDEFLVLEEKRRSLHPYAESKYNGNYYLEDGKKILWEHKVNSTKELLRLWKLKGDRVVEEFTNNVVTGVLKGHLEADTVIYLYKRYSLIITIYLCEVERVIRYLYSDNSEALNTQRTLLDSLKENYSSSYKELYKYTN